MQRRLPAFLLLLALWLHAAVMVPLHSHAKGQACDTVDAVTQLADTTPDTAHAESCPDEDAACVWCTWAHFGFALVPPTALPVHVVTAPLLFSSTPADAPPSATPAGFQARGPPPNDQA